MDYQNKKDLEDLSLMSAWERGSPMRSFIYYLQRAICGALSYLVLHQMVLGLRLFGLSGKIMHFFEGLLYGISTPGRLFVEYFFDPMRPLYLPPPLATFFINILFFFITIWIVCYFYNAFSDHSFVGKKGDPFKLAPNEKR